MPETVRQIRQGDVLLIRRPTPQNAVRVDSPGLRVPGERTGHAHVLAAEVYDTPGGRLLKTGDAAIMLHEEHAPVEVPEGWWEPRLQREFVPSSRPINRLRYD